MKFHFIVLFMLFVLVMTIYLIGSHKVTNSIDKTKFITVKYQAINTALYYAGTIEPMAKNIVTSKVDGIIDDVKFHYSDAVKTGDILFSIESEKFQQDSKTSIMQYIKAKKEYIENATKLKQSQFLHRNQLISDNDYHTDSNSFYISKLNMIQAEEDIQNSFKKNNLDPMEIYNLSIENPKKIADELHQLRSSSKITIHSPSSGILLYPNKEASNGEFNKIEKGSLVKQGDVLGIIGDTEGFIIHINVNEFDIGMIKVGQKVKVTGIAFPDFILNGEVFSVIHQGQSNQSGTTLFPVEIKIPTLTMEERSVINIGMSAKVEIEINSIPKLTIPLNSIVEKDGKTYVHLLDIKGKKSQEVSVKISKATIDSAIVESTLQEGDKIEVTD